MTHSTQSNQQGRVVMLGIDGVPHSFVVEQMRRGRFPHFQQLLTEGDMARMASSVPPISSVAWTCIATGCNPAAHNIFGFVDRRPNPIEMFLPTAMDRKAPAVWDILGNRFGKKVIVMNVPVNYPPRPVNGIMVSCFLATELHKATYPADLAPTLESMGYVIDVDPWKAREDKAAFLDDLFHALDRRLHATLHLMERHPWDFFMSHIMETDRLCHFFWEDWENGHPEFAPLFMEFFDKVDAFLGEVRARMPRDARLVVLSDHGFCALKKEVHINCALRDAGLLSFNTDQPKNLGHIAAASKAYSMIPGRIFVNLRGREQNGSVTPGAEYERVLDQVAETLLAIRDPEDGSPVIKSVLRREDIYKGPFFESAADLVALPFDGYDLKGALHKESMFEKTQLCGMHTSHDALFYAAGQVVNCEDMTVLDVLPSVLSYYGIEIPGLEGRNVFPLKDE